MPLSYTLFDFKFNVYFKRESYSKIIIYKKLKIYVRDERKDRTYVYLL